MIWLIRAVFALQSLAFGAWLPRIPEVRDALDLSPSILALALLGMPAGIMVTLPFAGRVVGRLGAGPTLVWLFPPYLVALALPPLAPDVAFLFLALALVGALMSLVELAENLTAGRIEKATGRLIMASCHGFWSLGLTLGSVLGAALAGMAVGPGLSLAGVVALAMPLSMWLVRRLSRGLAAPMGEVPAAAPAPPGQARRLRLPSWPLLATGGYLFGLAMAEGAMMDWAALYLRDVFGRSPAAAGLALTAFAGSVMMGRLLGDRARLRFGAARVARATAALALVSLGALVVAPVAALAYVAVAVLGLGVSLAFPLSVSAAADLPGHRPEGAVAVVTFIALLGFLVGPVLIGLVAEWGGLRLGLAAVGLPVVASLALAGALRPRPRVGG